jgi:hypothetical protein
MHAAATCARHESARWMSLSAANCLSEMHKHEPKLNGHTCCCSGRRLHVARRKQRSLQLRRPLPLAPAASPRLPAAHRLCPSRCPSTRMLPQRSQATLASRPAWAMVSCQVATPLVLRQRQEAFARAIQWRLHRGRAVTQGTAMMVAGALWRGLALPRILLLLRWDGQTAMAGRVGGAAATTTMMTTTMTVLLPAMATVASPVSTMSYAG